MPRKQGRGLGKPKITEVNIEAAKKRAQALELRAYGATYRQIADRVGYANPGGAWKAVDQALREVVEEPARRVKTLELERLDMMLVGLLPRAIAGNVGCVDRVIRIMDRRAKYLGLDAPLLVEWQREATNAGFDAAATFEELVQYFGSRLADADGDGSPEGSHEAGGA